PSAVRSLPSFPTRRSSDLQPREELGGWPAAAVGVLHEEPCEPFLAEPLGAVRGGIAAEEGQGDGRIDVGEDRGGPGPETVEQRPDRKSTRLNSSHVAISYA